MGFLWGAFISFLWVVGVHILVRENYKPITSVQVSGGVRISGRAVSLAVERQLNSWCFLHAQCKYELWYEFAGVSDHITKSFPVINTFSERVIDGVMYITITEKVPAFIWCENTTKRNCFFMSSDGVAFEKTPRLSGYIGYPFFIPDKEKIRVSLDNLYPPFRVFDTDEAHNLSSFIQQISNTVTPITILYTKRDIVMSTGKLYAMPTRVTKLLFNRQKLGTKQYSEDVLKTLSKFETYGPFFSRFKAYPDSLKYLDLRFPGRVYMKFQ
jgi:hypothetical protein